VLIVTVAWRLELQCRVTEGAFTIVQFSKFVRISFRPRIIVSELFRCRGVNVKKALMTIGSCFLALLIILSVMSSKQAARERQRQEALRQWEKENAEEAALQRKAPRLAPAAQEVQANPNYNADEDIDNLRSSDREVVNEAIQRIQSHKACKAVPDLLYLLETSRDDYIAGISAQTIAVCKDRSSYDTIVDQFLRRNDTPSMIDAIG
jgi:hypothetical protein